MNLGTRLLITFVGALFASVSLAEERAPLIAEAVNFSGIYSKLEEFDEKKVCTKGKPCGNTCINVTYTCRISTTPTAPTTPSLPTNPSPSSPAVPDVAVKPPSNNCVNAQVVEVVDGDTLLVARGQTTEKVRISQVDAPEASQAYGRAAAACLRTLVSNPQVRMCIDGTDRYGRTLANVTASSMDVGQQLVARGCAWAYSKYLERDSILPQLQARAQLLRLGLWGDVAIPPWEYRGSSAPVPRTAAGSTPVTVTTTTMATPVDRILDWAEAQFPDVFRNGGENIVVDTGAYRCYDKYICAGSINDQVLLYNDGTFTDIGKEDGVLGVTEKDGF